jgi:hypothetical protein
MKAIRKYVYAAALTVSALSLAPGTADAQDKGGAFALPHEVHWQNAVVPAGEYRFTVEAMGPAEMLNLRKMSGAPASFMLVVNDADVLESTEPARLIIKSEAGVSYVSAMSLPQFELALHFAAPRTAEKELAQIQTASTASPAGR